MEAWSGEVTTTCVTNTKRKLKRRRQARKPVEEKNMPSFAVVAGDGLADIFKVQSGLHRLLVVDHKPLN